MIRFLSIFFVFLSFSSFAAEPLYLSFTGHISKEDAAKALDTIDKSAPDQTFVIEINSTSADIQGVLALAKEIYRQKVENKHPVLVYINENAIGPAAILPFLADTLDISLFVTWGDIQLGSEKVIATNVLRNQVISLISQEQSNASLLKLLAAAMVDPSADQPAIGNMITAPGQPLVINHEQLQALGLLHAVVSPEEFHKKYQMLASYQLPQGAPSLEIPPNVLEERLNDHIKYHKEGANQVGRILIDDRTSGINQGTWIYVKNALDHYKKTKPAFVILELNTPGGEVFSAQKISDALKDLDTQYGIPVIAYINNWAISAGAMLAYSCRFIAVVKDASMGAAEPLTQSQTGETQIASEKINSALRTDFANRAAFFDRNPYIAESMVDKDIILVLRYGKIVKLDNENQIRTTGTDPDIVISPKGKLLTLDSKQLIQYGVADIYLPPKKLEPLTPEELQTGKWPASKELLFENSFFAGIPQATVDTYQIDWKTRFFMLLAHPVVSSLLFMGLMIGAYVEISSGGFGLAATVALTCLFLIILSSFALEIAGWLEVILLFTGLAILLIEIFVLPTFGLLGIIGIILFLAGLLGLMLPGIGSASFEFDTQTFNAAGQALLSRFVWLCGSFLLGIAIIIGLGRYLFPSFSLFRRFVLAGHEQEQSAGYIAGDDPSKLPQPGARGEVLSTLRPAGKVLINDAVYDAISPGNFIEKGKRIIVVKLDGSVMIVNEEDR